MNLYILVEGKQTERRLYPSWLASISPSLKKVDSLSSLNENNFYLISGEGYPRMIDVALVNSLKDIRQFPNISNFWIVMDSEGSEVSEKRQYVLSRIEEAGIDINHCTVDIIIQDPCIETWGLGNKIICSKNKLEAAFTPFYKHYDVNSSDPEKMQKPDDYEGSIAKYHESYLKSMLALRNATYTKKNPAALMEPSYLQQLVDRANDGDNHLGSFKHFHDLARILVKDNESHSK